MRRVSTLYQCPICKGKTKVDFVKPGLLKPTRFKPTCSDCDSQFLVQVTKERGGPSRQVIVRTLEAYPSASGIMILNLQSEIAAKQASENKTDEVSSEAK